MSLYLQIDDYKSIHDYLDKLKIYLRPEFFSPKQQVDIYSPLWSVFSSHSKNKIAPAEWGMMPNWDRKKHIPRPLTIARAETLYERVSYKSLVRRYRALIPVNAISISNKSSASNDNVSLYKLSHQHESALGLGALYQFNVDGNMQVVLITRTYKFPHIKKTLRLPLLINPEDIDAWLNVEKKPQIDKMLNRKESNFLKLEKLSNRIE